MDFRRPIGKEFGEPLGVVPPAALAIHGDAPMIGALSPYGADDEGIEDGPYGGGLASFGIQGAVEPGGGNEPLLRGEKFQPRRMHRIQKNPGFAFDPALRMPGEGNRNIIIPAGEPRHVVQSGGIPAGAECPYPGAKGLGGRHAHRLQENQHSVFEEPYASARAVEALAVADHRGGSLIIPMAANIP